MTRADRAGTGIEPDGSPAHDVIAGVADTLISYRVLAHALLAAADTQLSASTTQRRDPRSDDNTKTRQMGQYGV
jgi:hypothetical protein